MRSMTVNSFNLVFSNSNSVETTPATSIPKPGTVNDLAMMATAPLAMTSATVTQEGFAMSDLCKIVASMDGATREVDTAIYSSNDFQKRT
jgi:hydrogenase maturation factor